VVTAIARAQFGPEVAAELSFIGFGWGAGAALIKDLILARTRVLHPMPSLAFGPLQLLSVGLALCAVGCALAAFGIQVQPAVEEPESEARGAKLYPRLARYRDFNWGTLFCYGGGILAAELGLIVLHTALVGGIRFSSATAVRPMAEQAPRSGMLQLAPTTAFVIALLFGCLIAFIGGFLGASRARRLSTPEATIGLVYFGVPIPLALTALSADPELHLRIGYRLREITYLAGLLGRPELGYWLVFVGLAVVLMLGITAGFVVTGGGKVDLHSSFELYVARRHAAVFRPGLLLAIFGILMLGIIPPLIVYAMVRAADAAVEHMRIRVLGHSDPLRATRALHEWKSKEQSPTAMMTALSISGVGVGVMALIIVLSVMSGFEVDLKQKILGTNAHVWVLKYTNGFSEYPEVIQKIRKVKGVVGATPFIANEVMVSSGQNISGALIKGIDPASVGDVTDLRKNVLPGGSLDNLLHPEQIPSRSKEALPQEDTVVERPTGKKTDTIFPGIILGREFASSLKVTVGDRIDVVHPLGGELGPQGPVPKSRPFRVAGIFYSGMYEYDAKFVYIRLDEAQKFFNVQGVTGIELKVADIDDARRIAKAVNDELDGWPYHTKDWGEMNRNLFSALRLEKLVMGIILTMIVIVAAGLIVATVIMLVLEKRKEIAVLKALGVADGGIVKIFLAEGLQIGVAGGLLGLLSGIAWCLFIEKIGVKLDPQVYYIPALPVKIEPFQTAVSVVIAVLVTYLASVYPALKASQVDPVEGLKAE
jgi:lipoprotein-releasing system permease protein